MSSVQFLHFPSSIQHQIVRKMNLRELVKFSYCSKRTNRAVKSAEIPLDIIEGHFEDGRLEMKMRNSNGDSYEVCINPYELVNADNNGPEYIGFEGLRMYDYTEVFHQVSHAGIVILPDDQNFLETSDSSFLKNSKSLTRFELLLKWRKGFYVYSEGFQQENVSLNFPSYVHWDAVLNSTSRVIYLLDVRTLYSGDLNRFLKLWVSNEKLQRLRDLNIGLVRREGLEFPPDFLELALEGVRNYDVGLERWREIDEVVPGLSNERKISRINGNMATVRASRNAFRFQVD